jgi:hypothetical protein
MELNKPPGAACTYLVEGLLVKNKLRDEVQFWPLSLDSIRPVVLGVDLDADPVLVSLDTALEGDLNWR